MKDDAKTLDVRSLPKHLHKITLRPQLRLSDARIIRKALTLVLDNRPLLHSMVEPAQEGMESADAVLSAIARVRERLDATEAEARLRQTEARRLYLANTTRGGAR